ncbi:replication terminator protein [Evansella tamaricis]|uniref:Replication terminator protein n=1 Tax=Evansella tamaricis TaxID=2069301 RepID=A0ABS6JBN1_9BACI|nr:replication terminator protein [Evansella tamaricis]MBU9711087.1 replication terminator protein [Evansella tamaricis]
MPKQIVDLNTFADGALAERFNEELLKILQNIADPNTEPHKVRTLNIKVKLAGDEQRNLANSMIEVSSKLIPSRSVPTKVIIDYDENGQLTGAELKSGVPGQTYLEEDGLYSDRGEKIYDFKSKKEKGEVVND